MFLPYTEEEELKTTCAPVLRATSKTFNVPVALTSWVATGFFKDRGTEPRAAK
jgi:hypothetical protein